MLDDMVEIAEHYEGAKMVRKTANGIDLPLDDPNLPTVVFRRMYMTKAEVKQKYGVEIS